MVPFLPFPISSVVIGEKRRPAKAEKVAQLADSIREIGLLNPITVTTSGVLVAGRHRLEACKRLGWEEIPATVVDLDALQAELAEIDENLIRNELSELEQGVQLARRKEIYLAIHPETGHGKTPGNQHTGQKREDATVAFSQNAAAQTGQSQRTVARKVQIGEALAEVAPRLMDTPVADNQKDLLALARMGEGEREEVIKKLESGAASDVGKARTQLKREATAEIGRTANLPSLLTLHHDDFRLAFSSALNGAVDLIFTDPPYDEESLILWDTLAAEAARVLKPGGLLIAYSGQRFLDKVMSAVGCRLDYYWMTAVKHTHGQLRFWDRKVWNTWKPVVLWSKGKPEHDWFRDLVEVGDGETKDLHEWAQPIAQASLFIERFSQPGQLVIDPMCGSGTIPIAAAKLGRRAIGYEIDKTRYLVARGNAQEVLGEQVA